MTIGYGFMEEPNVERTLVTLAEHHAIDLPRNPHHWMVHVSVEQLHSAEGASLFRRFRLGLFSFLRGLSQPGHAYYGLGRDVHLTMEVVPVKIS